MKYIKTFASAAVATMALLAFAASSASATALYNGTTKLGSGAVIDLSIPSGSSVSLVDTEGEPLDTCTSGTILSKLSTINTGALNSFTWSNCIFPTSTVTLGKLEIIWTSGTKGTVRSDAEVGVTMSTVFFGSCVYGVASGTSLGTLTTFSSGAATFDLNAIAKKLTGSNIACPETAKWTGTFTGTEPSNLRVEES